MDEFFIEVTDTFGGEANYSWVRRYIVKAKTKQSALAKVSHENGFKTRKIYDSIDESWHNVNGACIRVFVRYADSWDYKTGHKVL